MPTIIPSIRLSLEAAAHQQDRVRSPSERRRPHRGRSFAAVALAMTVLVAGIWGASRVGGTSLPIFDTAPAAASALPADLRAQLGSGNVTGHLKHAYPFMTANGTGYVVTTHGPNVCLVVPDTIPHSFGSSCAPRSDVERRGLEVTLQSATGPATAGIVGPSRATILLPGHTSSATWRPDEGRPSVVHGTAGIVNVTILRNGTLSWATPAGTHAQRMRAVIHLESGYATCSPGHDVRLRQGQTWNDVC